jgi:hypothetical protein
MPLPLQVLTYVRAAHDGPNGGVAETLLDMIYSLLAAPGYPLNLRKGKVIVLFSSSYWYVHNMLV